MPQICGMDTTAVQELGGLIGGQFVSIFGGENERGRGSFTSIKESKKIIKSNGQYKCVCH
jgi:hypothetical protein